MLAKVHTAKAELIDQLYTLPDQGKAEIVDGEIVPMSPTGGKPGRIGGKIYRRGEVAEAEPALSGWGIPVDEIFR